MSTTLRTWLLLALAACTPVPPDRGGEHLGRRALGRELEYLFSDPSFAAAHWGVFVQSLDTGEVLFGLNEHRGFVPASNAKLYTTAAALALLGPAFRFETTLWAEGALDAEGTLHGDLIVRGSGDPSLAARHHGGNPRAPFDTWANELLARGVRRVTGAVIGDDDAFDEQAFGLAWEADDLDTCFAAGVSALSFDDNCVELWAAPGAFEGAPLRVRRGFASTYSDLVVAAVTAPAGTKAQLSARRDGRDLVVAGQAPLDGRERKVTVAAGNPTRYTVTALRDALVAGGIAVDGEPRDVDELEDRRLDYALMEQLAAYRSPPLADLVREVNKESRNLYAENLLRVLGARFGGAGSARAGSEVIEDWLDGIGVEVRAIGLVDGSGLSRRNLVTPRDTVRLLAHMAGRPEFAAFFDSLPVAGVDGTLDKRMLRTAAAGNVHAKTGTISFTKTISGYLDTRAGERLVFSLMVNHNPAGAALASALQDLVCQRLVELER